MSEKNLFQIIDHHTVAPGVRRMKLSGRLRAAPGQFVHVRITESSDPLLRRPFSIYDCCENSFSLLYRITGKGTLFLSEKRAGEMLDVLGPLGNGFLLTKAPEAVLIAGGMGIAPLFFLYRELASDGKTCHLFMGAKNKSELYLYDELIRLVPGLQVSTDDGSSGYHGLVTELAASAIAGMEAPVYACGPGPMLQETARLCTGCQRELFLSLEAYMACGVGACLGCTVAVRLGKETHYRRVCVDGPVFRGEEVFPRERA